MAIEIIDKLKQKNGGTFKLMDAADVAWDEETGLVEKINSIIAAGGSGNYLPLTGGVVTGNLRIDGSENQLVLQNGAGILMKNANGTITFKNDEGSQVLGTLTAEQYTGNAATATQAVRATTANNAEQLGGHGLDYFATADQLNGIANGLEWKPSAADTAALKALKAPQEGWTCSVDDTNAIYRFDAANTAENDAEDGSVIKADDGTAGAWVRVGTPVYNPATQQADGLMSAADKKKLDGLSNYELPAASTTVLGGIKAGEGVNITADGTLSILPGLQAATNEQIDAAMEGV